jgi:hypothetical protein
MTVRLQLGAPGIYTIPDEPVRALTGARMDVCAFVGVAPRGPARPRGFDAAWARSTDDEERAPARSVAVPIESLDAYRRLYGGFEGPGLMPYAVASFFEQGGVRAYVVRVVHAYATAAEDAAGVASGELYGEGGLLRTRAAEPVRLTARDEGAWGNALAATLSFTTRPLAFEQAQLGELILADDVDLAAGALLRLTMQGGGHALRYATAVVDEWHPEEPRRRRHAILDTPLLALSERAEVVEGSLAVDDGDGRVELHERLGLSASHPRWIARVLYEKSILLHPDAPWIMGDLDLNDPRLGPLATRPFNGGEDRYPDIVPDDFFGSWVPGDPAPGAGIHAILTPPDIASLCVPDLYSPGPLAPLSTAGRPPGPLSGDAFVTCVDVARPAPPAPRAPELDGLRLDPTIPGDLAVIIGLQKRVVDLAEMVQSFVALLDVPPGLHQRQIVRWRESFRSAYAAAYHPWLRVSRPDDRRGGLVRVNPSAFAAGIIAQRELALGIPHGPANVIAAGAVDVDDAVSPARHDELHPLGINVFLRERDGIRLMAARTLSRDPGYRQLSVRRLITMLRRTLDQRMQWAVFEPNNASLRADMRHTLRAYLGELYRANAFRGATEEEAFFVRCDDELNPQRVLDAGQLIVEVGVAPAEPLEFLVLRITRGGDGALTVEG